MTNGTFKAVYGPVKSWRFGQSLGIDPIGQPTTCSFNCAYCQLGEIHRRTAQRQVFIPTEQIHRELADLDGDRPIDVVTLSGSGEPTLALNLAEILAAVRSHLSQPIVVLTNSTLLTDPAVRTALHQADQVVAKLDAVSNAQLQRVNRPVSSVDFETLLAGIRTFAQDYPGHLALQTMLLQPWSAEQQASYVQHLHTLQPDEVQLNVPSRPRVLTPRLEARGNQAMVKDRSQGTIALEPDDLRQLKCVDSAVVHRFAEAITTATGIPTRCPPIQEPISDVPA